MAWDLGNILGEMDMVADPYAWHRAALAGNHPIVTDEPHAGFYLVTRDERMIPASSWWEGLMDENGEPCADETMLAEIGGELCYPEDRWLDMAKRPISQDEYNYWLDRFIAEGGLDGRPREAERAVSA